MSSDRYGWGWPAGAIIALLATVFLPRPSNVGLWLHTLIEWLHVPVFGLLSLALLALMPRAWRTWQRFGLAFVGALVLGVLSEAVQIPMSRDASWEDIVADGAGAAGFLSIAYAWSRSRVVAILSVVSGLVILSWSALPLASVSQAIIKRNAQFPVIFGGDIEAERAFVTARNVQMETHWDQSLGRLYTRIEIVRQHGPGIEIRDLVADWSSYTNLNLYVEVEGTDDLSFTIRVHDKAHRRGDQPHNDRFNRRFTITPGQHILSIPLEEIEAAPATRPMDMTRIEALILFSAKDDVTRILRLYEIRLD